MRILTLALFTLAACASSTQQSRPLGVDEHLAEAARHEADAEREEQVAREAEIAGRSNGVVCGDTVLADQTTSGGERIVRIPCWTEPSAQWHRDQAEALRIDARRHREHAGELQRAERENCAKLAPSELEHTPFAHHDDIASVVAELDGDAIRGARIRFEPVEGLTAGWIESAIGCHRARAAVLGYDPTYMSYDPTLVDDAEIEVGSDDAGVIVVVRASDDADALVIYGRAEELIGGAW